MAHLQRERSPVAVHTRGERRHGVTALFMLVVGCSSSGDDDTLAGAQDAGPSLTPEAAHIDDVSNDRRTADALTEASVDGAVGSDVDSVAESNAAIDTSPSTSDASDSAVTVDALANVGADRDSSRAGDANDGSETSACVEKSTAPASARSARSAGFTGTDNAYAALYNVACQTLTECVTTCVAAGGTDVSCTSGSECIVGGLDNAKHCLPPTYWRNVAGGTSESGTTFDAAEQTLVVINYQDPIAFTGFGVAVPDDAQIVGIQFAVRKNADDGLAVDDAVRVLKGGAPVGADHHHSGAWPKELTYVIYGGPADTWGVTWRVQDIRGAGFGVSVAARYTDSAGNDRAHIDSVRVTVFYRMACN